MNKDLPVTNCTATKIEFLAFKHRKIEANFSEADITSDGGVLLLRSIDQRLKLTERIAERYLIPGIRARSSIRWSICYGNGFMGWRVATKT
jgi:hypothetical protein